MINKIKILIVAFCLLLSACASHPQRDFIARGIIAKCAPNTDVQTTTSKNVIINFKRYKNCFGYKDLIIVSWRPFNLFEVRNFVHTMLKDYLQKINKKASVLQYEHWGPDFFIIFEVKDK